MNYGRDHLSSAPYHHHHHQGYLYGNAAPQQQLGIARDIGMGGGRDGSAMRRGGPDLDPQLSRTLSGPAYPGLDPRVLVSGRGVQGGVDGRVVSGGRGSLPLPPTEAPVLNNQPNFNAGVVNRYPYDQGGGLLGPGGGMGSHLQHHPMRQVGVHNYSDGDSYGLLQQQQFQLVDGNSRNMFSAPEQGGGYLPGDVGLNGMGGGFRGGNYGGSEEALVAAQQQGLYQGRSIKRDGRLMQHMGGWEDNGPVVATPMSPRAMPMSPRRDELVGMMSPRRGELTPPPPMSPRRDDLSLMMSPRRGDISPPRSPRRRDYPTAFDYGGRLQRMRGFSPPWDEDYLIQLQQQPRPDFPMSPRRGAPITPPMSPPRAEWDYEGPPMSPRMSPPRMTPMSPRCGSPPPRSPVWSRSRHSSKAPSQWDILPEKPNVWNGGNERQNRKESRNDHYKVEGTNAGYRQDIDDHHPKRQGWSRRDEGRYSRGGDEQDYHRESGRSYGGQQRVRYGVPNRGPYVYTSVVNQRVGLVTKYIERERAERLANDAAAKATRETSRWQRPPDDEWHPINRSSRPSRLVRRNEKDSLAAAIAKTKANNSKHGSDSVRNSLRHERSSAGGAATAASNGKSAAPVVAASNGKSVAPAAAASNGKSAAPEAAASNVKSAAPESTGTITNSERTGGGDKTSSIKPSAGNVAETSVPCPAPVPSPVNGHAAAGSPGQLTTTQGAKDNKQGPKDSKNAGPSKPETEGSSQKNNIANNSGRQNNGPSNKPANGNLNTGSQSAGDQQREAASKRTSLVMEIERAKKSRKLDEDQKHSNSQEVEETYYDANELSTDFVAKMNRACSRFSCMINENHYLKRKYQSGGQGGLDCLVCGKGSKTYFDVQELVTHAQHSQVQSTRIDHMGFRKALIDVLKLDIKDPPVSNTKTEEDMIVWPPVVVVENTRTGLSADKRWEGVTNSEMALLLNELGHLHGRPKSIWDKFGHRGIVHVEFESTLEGLQEAERLHNYFLQNGRGRVQWDIICPIKTGLPGFEAVPDGPDFSRLDEVNKTNKRVLYGYVALRKDVDKIFSKKQRKKVQVINRKDVKAKLLASQSGEVVI